jgi:hypothetical protein
MNETPRLTFTSYTVLTDIRAEVAQKEPGTKQYLPAKNPEDENEIFIWEEVSGSSRWYHGPV